MKKIVALILCLLTIFPIFTACGSKDDPNKLNIVCLNKGYGEQWINTIARKFEQEHAGITVDVNCAATADQIIEKNLASSHNKDDLYICVGGEWKMYAVGGKFAELDDILDDLVDGVALKDKVADEYENSIYFPNSSGVKHTYRLPWTAGFGGIFYNSKMFEAYGWQVPTTYEQLVALCETIVNAKVEVGDDDKTLVKPFVYTSANTDYFDYAVFTWWSQITGINNIKEFTQYSSADNFDTTKNDTYKDLQTATKLLTDLFSNDKYVLKEESHNDAQKSLNNGYAAMMFNGEWVYNEIKNYQINNPDFELAVMKTPTAPDAKENSTYTVGEDQYIAIPKSSKKQALAKEFIKLLVSDFGCETFMDQANGLLAYDITSVNGNDVSSITNNKFVQNLYTVKSSYDNAFTGYPNLTQINNVREHNAMIYLANKVDIWSTGTMRPYKYILDGTYTLEVAFAKIAEEASTNWAKWQNDSGVITK